MTRYIQVVTAVGTKADAEAIARAMVEDRLAGCGQVLGPMSSAYWWEGQVEIAEEWLCLLKSRSDLYEELQRAMRSLHPYQEPEILAVPVSAGSESYLEWLSAVLR